MPKLEPLRMEELTTDELVFLDKSIQREFDDSSLSTVLRDVLRGKAMLWRFSSEEGGAGVLVLRFIKREGGVELFFHHLGGKGMMPHLEFIFKTFAEFGKEHGCRWMTGLSPAGLARVYKRLGFESPLQLVVKEI